MAKKPEVDSIELLYMMLADALWSADGGEPAHVVRERIIRNATPEQQAALGELVNERRALYPKPSALLM